MGSTPRLFLIDGHALAYRTYFALTRVSDGSRWVTKSGEPTAGTYGFASVLLKLLEQDAPEYLAVSFDTGKTFRDDLYPEYKATRDKMPDDLRPQLIRIRQMVAAFGIPVLEAEGFEADDVLGTVAQRAAAQGVRVVILTGDRDLLQLADENIHIQLAGQKLSEAVDYGPAQVQERFGVPPERLVDYKALVGDTTDNIPGVHGIGEKTAASLLTEHGSLDAVYENLDKIPARFQARLREERDLAFLSRQLAAIRLDVPIEFDLEACRARGYDRERVAEIFRELEFRALLPRITPPASSAERQLNLFVTAQPAAPVDLQNATAVSDEDGLRRLVRELEDAKHIAFDVESTSVDAMTADLVGIALAVAPDHGYYIPVGHAAAHAGAPQLDLGLVLNALRPALEDASTPKVGHNLKYDYIVLARHGVRAAPLHFDTMLAEWLCDPSSRNLGLKNLAWVRLAREMTEIEALIGKGRGQLSMAEVPVDRVAAYAADDARTTLQLLPLLQEEMQAKNQLPLFHDLEMPLVSVLADMEMAGVALDAGFLGTLSQGLSQRLGELEAEITRRVGHPFNINSTQQLSQVLFDELHLEPPDRTRRTAVGRYSTAASVLEELRSTHPVVDLILEHREVSKLRSTYTDALPQRVNRETGRVHTSFSQTGSVTGRLASSDPNLQNIPIRSDLGRQIRHAFIAEPGHLLVSVDYSQIELRIVAHVAQDQAMIQAFHEDQDIHAATAAAVFGVAQQAVTPEMRRHAKAVNFGLIYGMSAFGLSRSTDLTLAEAEQFVKVYFERFPGVRAYLEATRRRAAEVGYVETLLGRRRYFPQLASGAAGIPEVNRNRAEREAVNAPIQGSAADIIKLAMLRLPPAMRQAGLHGRMLLQVHDELVLEVPEPEAARTVPLVRQIMQDALTLRVPLKADAKVGRNWGEMTPA
jgi:DNA polymerase-1